MPLPENPSSVSARTKHVGHDRQLSFRHLSRHRNGRGTISHGVEPSHELPPRWRAHWRNAEVNQANAVFVEQIKIQRFRHGISEGHGGMRALP